MKQTQFFPKEIKMNFNLRSPKSESPTIVYLIINVRGKQYKVSLFVKVYSGQWSKDKQKAIVSNLYSARDNKNNTIVNRKIKEYSNRFVIFLNYLCCSNNNLTIPTLIKQIFYKDMGKREKYSVKQTIEDAFEYYTTKIQVDLKEGSINSYRQKLNIFFEYVKSHSLDSDFKVLTQDGLNEYRDYLVSFYNERKRGYEWVNSNGHIIRSLINNVLSIYAPFTKIYKYEKVSFLDLKDPRDKNDKGGFSLNHDEITSIINCEGLTNKQEQYRRFFLLQMALGGREGAVKNAIEKRDTSKGILIYETNKIRKGKNSTAMITLEPLYDGYPSIGEYLLGDKKPDLSVLSDKDRAFNASYNDALLEIGEKANLNREIEYHDQYGETKKELVKNAIHGHCARHTFITTALRAGWTVDEICAATGHVDDAMIKDVYSHLTNEDKVDKILTIREKRRQSATDLNTLSDKSIDIIRKGIISEQKEEDEKAKEYIIKVAEELGLDWKQWISAGSLGDTETLLYDWSEKIHDHTKLGVSMLKWFFNDNRGDIEKAKMQLLEYLYNKQLSLMGRPIEEHGGHK